ncbi:MAG: hypothetical protein AB1598_03660 [Thermodesulfobacteriota bacterium]
MKTGIYTLIVVMAAVSGLFTTAALGDLSGGETRAKLIGSWVWEEGEGISRTVTSYSFSGDGTFTWTVAQPGMPGSSGNRTVTGSWRLETAEKGLKAIFDEANMLILEYQVSEAGTDALVPTSKKYLVVISIDNTLGGKETLRLMPPDGSLPGTQYFFRAQ